MWWCIVCPSGCAHARYMTHTPMMCVVLALLVVLLVVLLLVLLLVLLVGSSGVSVCSQ